MTGAPKWGRGLILIGPSISPAPMKRVAGANQARQSRSRLAGWRDIFWRVLWSVSADRILSTSGGVPYFALLAVFPGIAAIVSLYGLLADASTIGIHLSLLSGFLLG